MSMKFCVRIFLSFFNFLLMVVFLAFSIVGFTFMVDSNFIQNIPSLFGEDISSAIKNEVIVYFTANNVSLGAILLVCGLLASAFCLLGAYTALKDTRFMNLVHFNIFGIIIIFQIVGLINCYGVFDGIYRTTKKIMTVWAGLYGNQGLVGGASTIFWDALTSVGERCCGVVGREDFGNLTKLPRGCCPADELDTCIDDGCIGKITNLMIPHSAIAFNNFVMLLIVQIILFVTPIVLISFNKSKSIISMATFVSFLRVLITFVNLLLVILSLAITFVGMAAMIRAEGLEKMVTFFAYSLDAQFKTSLITFFLNNGNSFGVIVFLVGLTSTIVSVLGILSSIFHTKYLGVIHSVVLGLFIVTQLAGLIAFFALQDSFEQEAMKIMTAWARMFNEKGFLGGVATVFWNGATVIGGRCCGVSGRQDFNATRFDGNPIYPIGCCDTPDCVDNSCYTKVIPVVMQQKLKVMLGFVVMIMVQVLLFCLPFVAHAVRKFT